MDEPTTALTWREVRALFRIVEVLRAAGVALVFVSHKIEEVLRISQRITVLRNGRRRRRRRDIEAFDRTILIRAMTGRTLSDLRPSDVAWATRPPVLEVQGLGLAGAFEDVSFDVRPGEVLGVTGLLGSGRTEIAEALFGVTPADRGSVMVDGKAVRLRSVRDAVRAGIGYVPADRLEGGPVPRADDRSQHDLRKPRPPGRARFGSCAKRRRRPGRSQPGRARRPDRDVLRPRARAQPVRRKPAARRPREMARRAARTSSS